MPDKLSTEAIRAAFEWINGKRDMCNIVDNHPMETREERVERANAAMKEQAYWVIRAYREGLLGGDMKLSEQQREEFREAAASLVEWMCKNCHPHVMALVTPTRAELVEGVMSQPIEEFVVN